MRRLLSLLLFLAAPLAAQDSYFSALPEDVSIDGTEWLWCEDSAFTVDSRCEIADIIAAAGGGSLLFKTIDCPAGTDPVADTSTDTLTLTGTGITVTGDSTADSVAFTLTDDGVTEAKLKLVDAAGDEECLTYESTVGDFEWQTCGGGGTNSFETIDTTSGTDPVADGTNDTLTLTAGTGITITGDSSTDTVTIAATGGSGDSITVNTTAATDANFADGDIDWTINTGATPDDITATVACSGCVDATDLATSSVETTEILDATIIAGDIASDAVTEPKLKAVDAAADEECLTYETTTGDFEWEDCSATNPTDDIAPYGQYDAQNPSEASGSTAYEFTSADETSEWFNQDAASLTVVQSDLRIVGETTGDESRGRCVDPPSSGNIDTSFHVRVLLENFTANTGCGLMILTGGTLASPTQVRYLYMTASLGVFFQTDTDFNFAAGVANSGSITGYDATEFRRGLYLRLDYDNTGAVLAGYAGYDGKVYETIATAVAAGADPIKICPMVRDNNTCRFEFLRVRTDADRLNPGE